MASKHLLRILGIGKITQQELEIRNWRRYQEITWLLSCLFCIETVNNSILLTELPPSFYMLDIMN